MERPSIMWFRRDLRLSDQPALARAADGGGEVLGLFVADPALLDGSARTRRLGASLRALNAAMGGALVVRTGDPAVVVPALAAQLGAHDVHVSADYAPYGRRRDARVSAELSELGCALVDTGSPYAVAPGRVVKPDCTPYRVYTPFYKAWQAHGWRPPAGRVTPTWLTVNSDPLPAPLQHPTVDPDSDAPPLPPAGEQGALDRWESFLSDGLAGYADLRNRPDLRATSALSAALRFGEIHPRTLLADLAIAAENPAAAAGAEAFRREIAFREFYADVLFRNPDSATQSLDRRFDEHLEYVTGAEADRRFAAWCEGRTGYPFVDAGMRQLLADGWVHNRVRMIVASFLVKDLHLPWWRGAEWFMAHLADGDLASNSQGWQWTAGCGTDAAPYYRIFNPVLQGQRFDPTGEYVRRYLPELRGLAGAAAHEPWKAPLLAADYPDRIVDHFEQKDVALARFDAMKAASA
ncbi:MAG: cryptochrome/photolyase family protein [Candidatus Nanopelagicales bacterium]